VGAWRVVPDFFCLSRVTTAKPIIGSTLLLLLCHCGSYLQRISLLFWKLLVYNAFHDQPEEDSGIRLYCCYRDNAMRVIITAYVDAHHIKVKLMLSVRGVSGFLVV